MLNEESACEGVSIGDAVTDTGFILGVDPQPIATGFAIDVDSSFIEPEFMPEYEVTFGDERAERTQLMIDQFLS
jgi:hypothetical protein